MIISIYKADLENSTVLDICRKIDGKKFEDSWLTAKPSKYNNNEVFIQYWYYEDIENILKEVFEEDEVYEIMNSLKKDNHTKLLRRTYAFINLLTNTLEIYDKKKTEEVKKFLEKELDTKFENLCLTAEQLKQMAEQHSFETKVLAEDKIIFIPKIKLLNGKSYEVAITKNGELKFRENGIFVYRPRFEIRQLVFMISSTIGLLKQPLEVVKCD